MRAQMVVARGPPKRRPSLLCVVVCLALHLQLAAAAPFQVKLFYEVQGGLFNQAYCNLCALVSACTLNASHVAIPAHLRARRATMVRSMQEALVSHWHENGGAGQQHCMHTSALMHVCVLRPSLPFDAPTCCPALPPPPHTHLPNPCPYPPPLVFA